MEDPPSVYINYQGFLCCLFSCCHSCVNDRVDWDWPNNWSAHAFQESKCTAASHHSVHWGRWDKGEGRYKNNKNKINVVHTSVKSTTVFKEGVFDVAQIAQQWLNVSWRTHPGTIDDIHAWCWTLTQRHFDDIHAGRILKQFKLTITWNHHLHVPLHVPLHGYILDIVNIDNIQDVAFPFDW